MSASNPTVAGKPINRAQVVTSAVITSGTTSAAVALEGYAGGGFILPSGFSGTTMTFTVSSDGSTFVALNNDDGAISKTVAASKAYTLPTELFGFPWFKFVSGSSETSKTISVVLSG